MDIIHIYTSVPEIGESWCGGGRGVRSVHVYGYPEHEGSEGLGVRGAMFVMLCLS